MSESILDQYPDFEKTNQEERINFLAQALAEGVKADKWSSMIRVEYHRVGGEDEYETWESLGSRNYRDRLGKYLSVTWDNMQPRAAFLESYGYLRRITPPRSWTDDVNSRPIDYIITSEAIKLTERIVGPVSVFISYRRKISSIQALMLSYWLTSIGVENFLDIRGITRGENLHPQIKEAIDTRSHFICILGAKDKESTLDSEYVQQEIELAMTLGKKCIPLLQHNWVTPPSLEKFSQPMQDFLKIPGEAVAKVTEENGDSLANAYADALKRLLPFLNRSQLR